LYKLQNISMLKVGQEKEWKEIKRKANTSKMDLENIICDNMKCIKVTYNYGRAFFLGGNVKSSGHIMRDSYTGLIRNKNRFAQIQFKSVNFRYGTNGCTHCIHSFYTPCKESNSRMQLIATCNAFLRIHAFLWSVAPVIATVQCLVDERTVLYNYTRAWHINIRYRNNTYIHVMLRSNHVTLRFMSHREMLE
jgi:hypothetical protein